MTERRKNQSEEWTYFTLLFIYFITVNNYRFCISVMGYINVQRIGIGIKNLYRSITIHSIRQDKDNSCAVISAIFACKLREEIISVLTERAGLLLSDAH